MTRKALRLAQDDTCTGGLCLVGLEPVSTCILVEQLAQAREHTTWNDLIAPVLAALHCEGMQSTSEEGSGMLASVEHHLGAHHSPDFFWRRETRRYGITSDIEWSGAKASWSGL